MTISLVQSISSGVTGTAALALTLPNNVTAGNNLIVIAATQSSVATSSTITDSNGTFNLAVDSGSSGFSPAFCHLMIWYQESAAGGVHNITVTQAATARSSFGILMEWNGLFPSSSIDKTATAIGGFAVQNLSSGTTPATSAVNELIVAGIAVISSVGSANIGLTDPTPGFTSLGVSQSDIAASSIGAEACYLLAAAPAVFTAQWSWTDANTSASAAAIATFKGVVLPDPLEPQICL